MAETAANVDPGTNPTLPVAVINDGTADRQIVVLGAGDGTATLVDGTAAHPIHTDSSATTQPVSLSSQPLPTGASTEATLSALNTKIPASPAQEHTTAASPTSTRLSDGAAFYKPTTPTDTQPVSAASLPLPTGAATSAAQTTGNTSLGNLDTNLGAKADTSATSDTGTFSLISLFKRLLTKVIKSDTDNVTIISSALPTGAATAANQTTGNTSLSSLDTKTPAKGQATMANSVPVTLASDQGPAPTADDTAVLFQNGVALTPKKAIISASASGATQIVAAVVSKKIRVISLVLVSSGTVNVKFQSHVTPTDLTGLMALAANTGMAPAQNPRGHFETVAGEALDINLSAAISVGGWLTYIEV